MANAGKTTGKASKPVRGDAPRFSRGRVGKQEVRAELEKTDRTVASLDKAEGKAVAVLACPVCGSKKLNWIGAASGAAFDTFSTTVVSSIASCENCKQAVLPIEFSSEHERIVYSATHKPSAFVLNHAKGISLTRGIAHGVIPLWLMLSAAGLLAVYTIERSPIILALAAVLGVIGVYLLVPRK